MALCRQEPRPAEPDLGDTSLQQLRYNLLEEELTEFWEALKEGDPAKVAKELTDILYVAYGAGVAFGFDMDACFDAVHASNLTKLDHNGKPIFRVDGKILKSANYQPANMEAVLWPTH